MRMRSASYPSNTSSSAAAAAQAAILSCANSPTKKPATATRVPKFLRCLYDILHNEDQSILSWSKDGLHFQIYNTAQLELEILPKYFKHGKFASFQRQLNNFGFRKWTKTQSNVCTFSHHHYVRRHPQQLVELVISHNDSTATTATATQDDKPQPLGVHNGKRKRSDSAASDATKASPVKAVKRETQRPAALHKADAFDFEVESWSMMADIRPLEWATKTHLSHIKTESGNETPTSAAAFGDIAFDFSVGELDDILLAGAALDGTEEQIFDMRLLQECYGTAAATQSPPGVDSTWTEAGEFFAKAELEMYMQDTELWAGH